MKYSIHEAVIVEGRYDKQRILQLFDALVIDTGGFSIFKNTEKMNLIKKLSAKMGLIIFTDSDSAGMLIRNFIAGQLPATQVKHAYIPTVQGKEPRKKSCSKEGFLGVEGFSDEIIMDCITKAVPVCGDRAEEKIKKSHLYLDGLYGRQDSAEYRKMLMKHIELPSNLSVNAFLRVLNAYYTYPEYEKMTNICKK